MPFNSHVQGAVGQGGASVTTFNIVLGAAPTLGNCVCVGVVPGSAVTNMTAVDANGNAYKKSPASPSPTSSGTAAWCFLLAFAPSNASATITISWTTTASSVPGWADEFSYSGGTCVLNRDSGVTGGPGTTINTPSITPEYDGSMIWAAAGSPASPITAPTAGATLGSWTGAAGAITDGNMCEYDFAVTGAQAVQFTLNVSAVWTCLAMAVSIIPAGKPWQLARAVGPSYRI